ncbi:VENN motif pre-toxin domain-containing protein [Moraxella catarrhalis]|uniref:VENN motif pre-toxin domain-containing protein n=1 Tax=Moraxella catarrhalis TaxID=480 RepID=UPI0013D55445|nr:VENN motif pre-toxin domain-containing protein [Moraxella catarrhalis]
MWGDYQVDDSNTLAQAQKDKLINQAKLIAGITAVFAGEDVNVAAGVAAEAVENNAVNKSQSGNIIAFIEFFNNTNTKMGQLVGSDAEKAMLRLNDTNFKLMPSVTPPFNGINDRYIYTTKGGWIDMVHFLFYASEAYSYKKEMMENPSTSYLGLTQQEIVSKSINHAVKRGYLQEKLDSIKAPHSAYSYEDLPSDYYGAVFGANHFDPKSKISFGQQIYNYFKQELDVKSPYHAPNYNDLPDIDNKKHSGIFNRTINPMFIP